MRATRFRHPAEPFVAPPPNYPYCPSDFHFFASFFVVGRPLLATDLCRSPAVEITLLLNSRSRNLSQTPVSCVREIKSDRPEVIVTPVSALDRQVETVSKFGERTESCRYLDSRVFRFPHPPTPHPIGEGAPCSRRTIPCPIGRADKQESRPCAPLYGSKVSTSNA